MLKIRRVTDRRISPDRMTRGNLIPNPNSAECHKQNNTECHHSENESQIVFSHANLFLPRLPNEVKDDSSGASIQKIPGFLQNASKPSPNGLLYRVHCLFRRY